MIRLPTPDEIGHASLAELPGVIAALGGLIVVASARLASNPPPEPLVNQEEAAEALGIDLAILRHLTRSGRVPSTRVGKRRKLYARDLRAYAERCRALGVGLRAGPMPAA